MDLIHVPLNEFDGRGFLFFSPLFAPEKIAVPNVKLESISCRQVAAVLCAAPDRSDRMPCVRLFAQAERSRAAVKRRQANPSTEAKGGRVHKRGTRATITEEKS